jgi:hypothetical protein
MIRTLFINQLRFVVFWRPNRAIVTTLGGYLAHVIALDLESRAPLR